MSKAKFHSQKWITAQLYLPHRNAWRFSSNHSLLAKPILLNSGLDIPNYVLIRPVYLQIFGSAPSESTDYPFSSAATNANNGSGGSSGGTKKIPPPRPPNQPNVNKTVSFRIADWHFKKEAITEADCSYYRRPVAWQNLRLATVIHRKVASAALSTRLEATEPLHAVAAHFVSLVAEAVDENQQRLRRQWMRQNRCVGPLVRVGGQRSRRRNYALKKRPIWSWLCIYRVLRRWLEARIRRCFMSRIYQIIDAVIIVICNFWGALECAFDSKWLICDISVKLSTAPLSS